MIETQMEQSGAGHALHITFGVSKDIANMATVFGDKAALNAFNKAADDLFPDIEKGELGRTAKAIEASEDPQAFREFANGAIKLTMTKLQE
jgi:hypothetical protein